MEPERPIEKVLRAYANKRREQAGPPLDLHPVTRKTLQDEVGRKFAKPAPQTRTLLDTLAQFWPRFAVAFGILVVLGLAVALFLPGQKKSESFFASNGQKSMTLSDEAASASAPAPIKPQSGTTETPEQEVGALVSQPGAVVAEAAAPAPDLGARNTLAEPTRALKRPVSEPITPPTVQLEERRATAPLASADAAPPQENLRSRSFGTAGAQPSAAETPAAPAPTLALAPAQPAITGGKLAAVDQLRHRSENDADRSLADKAQVALTESAPAPAPRIGGATFQAEILKQNAPLGVAQRFSQASSGRKAKEERADKNLVPILAAFEVEQTGRQLRIIDNDGSVYTGYVQQSPAPARVGSSITEKSDRFSDLEKKKFNESALAASEDLKNSPGQTYSFSVSGTNRTLNEPVLFNGNLAVTNGVLSLSVTNVVNGALGVEQPSGALRLDNSRISGRAKIGNRSEVEVNALPTPR